MFLILMIVILYLCFFSMYVILTLVEHTKDIETLYDNYSKELTKINTINLNLRLGRGAKKDV